MATESPGQKSDDAVSSPDTPVTEDSERPLQFAEEEPLSDLVLVVEGKRLYTSRSLLAFASPVFKCMFTSQFKEKDQKEVQLPGKNARTVDEMLRFLHPATDEELQYGHDSAFRLLPIAEEYQLLKLTDKCEDTLFDEVTRSTDDESEFIIHCLRASARYGLEKLLTGVVKKCSHSPELVQEVRENQNLPLEIKFKILEERLDILEEQNKNYKTVKDQTTALRHRLRIIILPHEDHCRCRTELKLRSNMQRHCSYCSRNWCSDHVSTEAYRSSYWFFCNHRIGYTVSNDSLIKSFIDNKGEL